MVSVYNLMNKGETNLTAKELKLLKTDFPAHILIQYV
jgi:hypothetical protein